MTLDHRETGTSGLYFGQVMHARAKPLQHRFRYRVFSVLINLDELPDLDRRSWLFSHNRWNLFGFWDRDHGPAEGAEAGNGLKNWITGELARNGLQDPSWRIEVLCFPRVFGLVFNPLSIWFCHRRDGGLGAVLYEVHNTFGERHGYLMRVSPDRARDRRLVQQCPKGFYVSPFMDMEATYRFRLRPPGDRFALAIHQSHQGRPQMTATMTGNRVEFSDQALFAAFRRTPFLTLKVICGIHWQALRLWLKGARYHKRPAPPRDLLTLVPDQPVSEQPIR